MSNSLSISRDSATRASSASSFPSEDLFKAFNEAKQPNTSTKVLAGTIGAVAVPLNATTGAIGGAFKGMHYGAKAGNKIVPVIGAFVGGLTIGPVVGAVVQSVSDVKSGVVNARRMTGRYSFVNSGLSVKRDSKGDLQNILSSIPDERVSKDSSTGHTIVTINQADKPFVPEGGMTGILASLSETIDRLDGRYDAQGNRQIDVDNLLSKTGQTGIFGKKIAVKARDLRAPVSPSPELCVSKKKELRTSIYIQSNIQDNSKAGLAGLQFFDQLDRAVNGR